jgi:hemolysin D
MTSAKKIIAFPQRQVRRGSTARLLPAALESPKRHPRQSAERWGNATALFCLALAWASLGSVDIVATAPGKIIPSGRTKVIQPFETGVVRAITCATPGVRAATCSSNSIQR